MFGLLLSTSPARLWTHCCPFHQRDPYAPKQTTTTYIYVLSTETNPFIYVRLLFAYSDHSIHCGPINRIRLSLSLATEIRQKLPLVHHSLVAQYSQCPLRPPENTKLGQFKPKRLNSLLIACTDVQ